MKPYLYVGHKAAAWCHRPGVTGYLVSRIHLAAYRGEMFYERCLARLYRAGWMNTEPGHRMSIKDLRWKRQAKE